MNDDKAAHKYNVYTFPTLAYFRKQTPILYDGDLLDEEKVLKWLTSNDVFELKDEIEEVNRKMLDKLLNDNDFVAVFFCEFTANGNPFHRSIIVIQNALTITVFIRG